MNLDSIDRYVKGEVAAYIDLHFRRNNQKCHLGFCRIPPEIGSVFLDKEPHQFIHANVSPKMRSSICDVDWYKSAVFLGVTEFVCGPQGIIRSFVWAERQKQHCDFRRAIVGGLPAKSVVIEFGRAVSERKIGSLWEDLPACNSAGKPRLIENRTKVVDDIENDARQHLGEWFEESDFVSRVSSIGLFINKEGPWFFCSKFVDDIAEIGNVMLCANERKAWAIEQFCHDNKIRSEERPRISEGGTPLSDHSATAA